MAELRRHLVKIQSQVKGVAKIQYTGGKIEIEGTCPNLVKNLPIRMGEILDMLTSFLHSYQFEDCCGICGEKDQQLTLCMVKGNPIYMCSRCYDEVEKSLVENKTAIKKRKGNMATGIVGAIFGSLIGVAVWVLIGQMGYIAGIAGLIMAVCALKGYELLGGKINAIGLTICLVIVAGMVYIANMTSTTLIIYQEFKGYNISFFDVYKKIPYLLKTSSEFSSDFYRNLFVGYLLTIVASVSTVISIYKANTGSFKIKKMN